ncbi:LPXTG cell wall anchor domain-containing protein [Streptomyces sp. NBC_01498]|uniref:LAETG motif-containing sortase-dependent surface protein n=1 Tax=Streptomyces sp. NBC_01498 TaxID=2975870 RepID=UPI002E7BDBFD|nr:LAETG motif-containing sortase-dependent surface protein [Streptomyces sp. NBC_01498]WTL23761.1 LPXTG cell wall anchor domain-containing protein [Streptomyces sp. NBC_01498]
MTVFNRSWRRPGALVTVAAAGALGAGLFAAPAVAHTPAWTVTCSEVSVDLVNYTAGAENTVTLSVDGKDLLPTEKFGGEFHKKIELPKHDKDLTLHLVVKDGSGNDGSLDQEKTAPVCEGTEPGTEPSTTPPATPPAEEPTPEPEPSKTTEAAEVPSSQPSPAGDDLAETGSSSTTPLIAGAAAVILVAGAGITWAARKRRTVEN